MSDPSERLYELIYGRNGGVEERFEKILVRV